jgi:hypothetical protein
VLVIALPLTVFLGGAWVMAQMSERENVRQRLRLSAAPKDQKPLNQRLHYDVDAVQHHWSALDAASRTAEQRFLEFDLVFPFLYGAALAASLLIVWAMLGRPFNPVWLIAPVAVTVLADWTENLIQLAQLQRYIHSGSDALQATWIACASAATLVKLVFFAASFLGLLILVAVMVFHAATSP